MGSTVVERRITILRADQAFAVLLGIGIRKIRGIGGEKYAACSDGAFDDLTNARVKDVREDATCPRRSLVALRWKK